MFSLAKVYSTFHITKFQNKKCHIFEPILPEKRQTFRTACLTQITKTQAEDLSNLFSNQATINSAAQKKCRRHFPYTWQYNPGNGKRPHLMCRRIPQWTGI